MENVIEGLMTEQAPRSLIVDKRALSADLDLLRLHQLNPQRYPYLLESVAKGEQNTRYDILFAFPQEQIQLTNNNFLNTDFLQQFDALWKQKASIQTPVDLPFKGGWFLFLGYELAQQIEPKLNLMRGDDDFPVAFATRIPAAIIVDHHEQSCYFVAEEGNESCIKDMHKDFAEAQNLVVNHAPSIVLDNISEDDPEIYLNGVRRIKEYILDGDIFQVNLSRAWHAFTQQQVQGYVLYEQLRKANPAPFAGLIFHQDNYIMSSSPERLVCLNNGYVETRPIAGTRPRGEGMQQDQLLSNTLLSHPKEIAEHIMLIDLERNDLGRICRSGTVEVNELMCLESYRHVHHIVSNVRGKPKQNITPGEVIKAVFPGGTITGCPKVRCMEIINELEQEARGAYTGAIGYVNHDGSLDLNILIRTLTLINQKITLRAGAGIVADSDPEMELEESRAKARGLLRAIQNQLD